MYKHLSREERYQIHSLMEAGQNISQIAVVLGRHRSTISRELAHDCGRQGYRPEQACKRAAQRALGSRNARRVETRVWSDVNACLELQWSPEQIAAKLPVSHESIYLRVYADKRSGGQLHKHLRSQKARRKRYASARDRRGQIPNRRPISERPAHVEDRKQIGHWEGDTVIGVAHQQAIVTLVERKSGFVLIKKLKARTKEEATQAAIRAIAKHEAKFKTITFDNGTEFARHSELYRLSIGTFFCDRYSPWQKGGIENAIGRMRRMLPTTSIRALCCCLNLFSYWVF